MLQPIQFIRSTITEAPSNFMHLIPSTDSRNGNLRTSVDGLAARSFYESVVQENQDETVSSQSINQAADFAANRRGGSSINQALVSSTKLTKKDPSLSAQSSPVSGRYRQVKKLSTSDLLRSARENDLPRLSQYVSNKFNLDAVDMFGWTALMCAAQKGSFETVRLLVTSGADFRKKDSKNQSAADLASVSRQSDIASYLYELERNYEAFDVSLISTDGDIREPMYEPFFCAICGVTFEKTTRDEHQTSILHQLHCGHTTQPRTEYGLPESNVGFRLMRQGGWDSEKGLGAGEDGRKYPIRTVFKRNRVGLGGAKETPRVTHFPHLMKKVTYQPANGVATKKDITRKLARSRQKEIEWRRELNGT